MTRRARQWTVAVITLLVATALSAGWAWWVLRRTGEHPSARLASGQAWQQPDGSSVRIESWKQITTLTGQDGDQHPSLPGTSWVMVTMKFTGVTEQTSCQFELVGEEDLRWRPASNAPMLAGTTYCRSDEAGPDPTVNAVFQVPTDRLDEVVGVAFAHPMGLHQPPWLAKP